jgi:hypothetical protein
MNKKKKNIAILVVLLAGLFLFLFFRRKTTKQIAGNFSCQIPKLRTGGNGISNNRLEALYYNNPGGLVQTPNVWVNFNEVKDPNNYTRFKAFATYKDGIIANLYNLMYYIEKLKIKKVKDIVMRWVAPKNLQEYQYYVQATGFNENCEIDSYEKLRMFFANQMFAENSKNNTKYIYENFNEFYETAKRKGNLKGF